MIEIDMEMPTSCGTCPCSYFRRAGSEMELICEVLEGRKADLIKVDFSSRPDICPIREGERK